MAEGSRSFSKTIRRGQNSIVAPIEGFGFSSLKDQDWSFRPENSSHNHNSVINNNSHGHSENLTISSLNLSSEGSLEDDNSFESQNLQWAEGKAGENRVRVVVPEEHGRVSTRIRGGRGCGAREAGRRRGGRTTRGAVRVAGKGRSSERSELDRRLKQQLNQAGDGNGTGTERAEV